MSFILIIDDEAGIRKTLSELLRLKGHQVASAENGSVGLRRLSESPVDLVITDIFMPEKEGIETLLEIKRSHGDVKVIVMSGGCRYPQGMGDCLDMASRLGADCVFSKPLDIDMLLDAINRLCRTAS